MEIPSESVNLDLSRLSGTHQHITLVATVELFGDGGCHHRDGARVPAYVQHRGDRSDYARRRDGGLRWLLVDYALSNNADTA